MQNAVASRTIPIVALWFTALGCHGTLTTQGDEATGVDAGPVYDAGPDDEDDGPAYDAAPPDAGGDYESLSTEEQALFDRINEVRLERGLGEVVLRTDLNCAAGNHSLDIGELGWCGHTGSDGSSPGDRVADCQGEGWSGEIVACGQSTPPSAVDAWIGSPGHASIMFSGGQKYIGVAMHNNYWTAIFDQ